MYTLILFLGICSAFALGRKLTVHSEDSEKIVGCYYVIKEPYYNPQAELEKMGIDRSLCSHIFYSFVGIGSNGSVLDNKLDDNLDSDQFQYYNGRWKKNPSIKVLAQMADLKNNYSDNSADIMVDPLVRQKVVNNIFSFVKKYEFDGIDLDLTNVQSAVLRPTDKKNLVLLLKELKEKFDKEDFILSVSVVPEEKTVQTLYDIKGISTYVNFINLMAFNFNEPLNQQKKLVGHTSPLYHSSKQNAEERKKNIDYVVTYWIRNGAPADKLILGIAFNSEISYTLANPDQIGRGAPFTKEGQYSCIKYSQICNLSRKPEWKYTFDEEQHVPYLYNGNQIVPYDDVHSMKEKAEYVNKINLGGAVVQYVDQDDVDGKCGEKFALLKTLNRILRD